MENGYRIDRFGRTVRAIDFSIIDWNAKKDFYHGDEVFTFNYEELLNASVPIIRNLVFGRFYKFKHYLEDFTQECSLSCMYIFAVFSDGNTKQVFSLLKTYYRFAIWHYIKKNILDYEEKGAFSLNDEVKEDSKTTFMNFLPCYDHYDFIDLSVFTPNELRVYLLLMEGYSTNEIFINDKNNERIHLVPSIKAKLCEQLDIDPRSEKCKARLYAPSIYQYYRNQESHNKAFRQKYAESEEFRKADYARADGIRRKSAKGRPPLKMTPQAIKDRERKAKARLNTITTANTDSTLKHHNNGKHGQHATNSYPLN